LLLLLYDKKIDHPFLLFLLSISLVAGCGDSHSFKKAEDAQDAGREFIRASLDGNYEKASFFLYPDSTNQMLFTKWKKDYDALDHESQKKYRDADILVIQLQPVNDSTSLYTYTNTYKKIPRRSEWCVSKENGWSISKRSCNPKISGKRNFVHAGDTVGLPLTLK